MKIDHVCIIVSDMDRSLRFYRDLLGFSTTIQDTYEPGTMFDAPTLDGILGVEDAQTHIVAVASSEGAVLELQQALHPRTEIAPAEHLRYGRTGITELALTVPDVEALRTRVLEAGYRLQTDFIWSPTPGVRSFLFYDPDGALIQAVEVSKQN